MTCTAGLATPPCNYLENYPFHLVNYLFLFRNFLVALPRVNYQFEFVHALASK